MKKILFLIFSISLFFTSCEVDVTNPNDLEVRVFWKSEADAQSGVNAIYNMFYKPGTYSRWIWFRLDLTSDEGFSSSPWIELADWTRFIYNNYNFWEGNAWTYRDCYEAIFRANQALFHIPDIEFADQAAKDRLLGQAYFLRALYYYNLAILWGSENNSLPIVLEPSKPGDTPVGHPVSDIWAQAESDLQEAINKLPATWDANNKGRATKGAAYALRAKCRMQQLNWQGAQQDLEWMVKGEGAQYYDLVPNFKDNFTHFNENNMESVFELQYSDVHKAPAGDSDFSIDPNLGLNRGQFFAPPGIGWTDGEVRPWLVDEFKKEMDTNGAYDIRLRESVFYADMANDFPGNDKIYRFGMEVWNQDNYRNRIFFRKYGTDYYRNFDDYHSPVNVRLIRYADVLLMYAECLANMPSGDLTEAVAIVNRVRDRVDMPALSVNHAAATQSKEAFLKRLQMERSLELCLEGHRWADIKRWGLVDNQAGLDELKQRDPDFNNFKIGKHSRLPIPSSEVNNNEGLDQNPDF
ncbi:Starch-binding associating with outer membrane [Saccharicrinis carchari]|uniref:Starch-binding associating with outer membrane n=1 Tax=Saccharicrinis carchari TaxID=1168039 RepID=A0A521EYQ4_SACCC|nr:RagB/SusD family nutrient uptake outer membrane protein [Saccharicrinis carchari]SMO89039.1 Starch-binding associating with outer membrane [Saccharicrinis carchari]